MSQVFDTPVAQFELELLSLISEKKLPARINHEQMVRITFFPQFIVYPVF